MSVFLEKLNRFDKSFQKVDSNLKEETYRGNKLLVQYLTLLVIVVICLYVWFDSSLYMKEVSFILIGDAVAYCYPFITGLLIATQFCVFTNLLKHRFVWINTKLIEVQQHLNGLHTQ